MKAQPPSRREGSLQCSIWAQMSTLVLTLPCTALAKHGNFRGSALIDCVKHPHGSQKQNFREKIIEFYSHSFEWVTRNTSKALQEKNSSMQTKKMSSYVGFFFFIIHAGFLKRHFRNQRAESHLLADTLQKVKKNNNYFLKLLCSEWKISWNICSRKNTHSQLKGEKESSIYLLCIFDAWNKAIKNKIPQILSNLNKPILTSSRISSPCHFILLSCTGLEHTKMQIKAVSKSKLQRVPF